MNLAILIAFIVGAVLQICVVMIMGISGITINLRNTVILEIILLLSYNIFFSYTRRDQKEVQDFIFEYCSFINGF